MPLPQKKGSPRHKQAPRSRGPLRVGNESHLAQHPSPGLDMTSRLIMKKPTLLSSQTAKEMTLALWRADCGESVQ